MIDRITQKQNKKEYLLHNNNYPLLQNVGSIRKNIKNKKKYIKTHSMQLI